MKKQLKVGLLSTLAVLGVASAASCGGTSESSTNSGASQSSTSAKVTDLNVSVNYSQQSSVAYVESATKTLDYGEGITLTSGDILPTWKTFGQKLNLNILNGNDLGKTQKDDWTSYGTDGYKDKDGNMLDLVMGTQTLYDAAVANNQLIAISDHLNEMPNFKKWTENNRSTWTSMKSSDGKVYYTPYFDGLDDVEKMNIMNTEWVVKLLDGTEDADTSTTITSEYQPTVANEKEAKLTVYNGTSKTTITADYSRTNNAIYKQNLETTKNGQTLLAALKSALRAEYGNYIAKSAGGNAEGSSVIYNSLSEIFTGEKACYNVDDLVALIRVVKCCPKLLTGDETTKITPIIPRGSKTSRQYSIGELAAWWGVRGLSGENGNLYFDKDGQIKDARTNDETYTALNYLHQLYQEGLIYEGYCSSSDNNTEDKYRKTGIENGTVFLIYEYNTSTTQYNQDASGSNGKINLQAVLPPVCKWAENTTLSYKNTDGQTSEYTGYFHFTEDNRALKTGGWAIPATTDNLEGALKLMDYMFSDEGALIQDFGPDTKYTQTTSTHQAGDYVYWTPYAESEDKLTLAGVEQPQITQEIFDDIKTTGLGWNNYYRKYVGSTQGIGHVRHAGLDYECLFSKTGKAGLEMISQAMSDGVLVRAKTTFDDDTSMFFNSIPTGISMDSATVTAYEQDTAYKTMTNFWNNSKSKVVWTGSYVIMNGWDDENVKSVCTNYENLKSLFTQYDTVYTKKVNSAFDAMGIVETRH